MRGWGARIAVLSLLVTTACGAPAPGPGGYYCQPGQTISCVCPGTGTGTQTCSSAGTWSTCAGCVGTCTPSCNGRRCGDDGCGGSCGSCAPGLACFAGTCGVPELSQWVLTVTSGTVAQRGPDGSTWDSLGGAPDPFVCVTIQGARTCSRAVADSFTPTWNHAFPVIQASVLQSGVEIAMYDEDVAANDTICGGGTIAFPVSAFADGGGTLQCGYGTMSYTLTRR